VSLSGLVWVVGGAALVATGFLAAYLPARRRRARERAVAWSTARAAIDRAGVSRDAAQARVEEAERLLARAELIAADRGGVDAARAATDYARTADQLWRGA